MPSKNAFEHYFGLDKKGNVNVDNFQPLSKSFQKNISLKGIKKKSEKTAGFNLKQSQQNLKFPGSTSKAQVKMELNEVSEDYTQNFSEFDSQNSNQNE